MIDPSTLIDALVALLRDIPALVAEMNGDANRVYAYHDRYPKHASLAYAIHQMPAPSIMVAWTGTQPGSFGGNEVWRHQFTLYLRARESVDGDPPTGYARLFRLLTKGVPAGTRQPMQYATVDPGCFPMDTPSIERQTDAEGLDFFQVAMSFTEIGDE